MEHIYNIVCILQNFTFNKTYLIIELYIWNNSRLGCQTMVSYMTDDITMVLKPIWTMG